MTKSMYIQVDGRFWNGFSSQPEKHRKKHFLQGKVWGTATDATG